MLLLKKTVKTMECGFGRILAALSIMFMLSGHTKAGITRIWAVDDGEKIKREDLNHPLAASADNPVWDGSSISLFGVRNEVVAFQLIIEADASGTGEVDVRVSDLTQGANIIPGSATGPSDPFDYRGRYIELFTQHYLQITQRTSPAWFYDPDAAPSDYYLGWVPDCLVPFAAPAGKGGAPFDIFPQSNQGVWIDIWIPRDAVPGEYSGSVQVIAGGEITHTIELALRVYDLVLPDESHIANMFFMSPYNITRRHGVSNGSQEYYNLEARYHQMAHRHRFDLIRSVWNLSEMNNYHRRYLNGELYTDAQNYAGPGESVGNNTFVIGPYGGVPEEYGGSRNSWSEQTWRTGSDAWENWFRANAPHVERLKYLYPDEPEWSGETDPYGLIQMQADWTHNNPGPGRDIPCFVTSHITAELKGYVDFWSVSGQYAASNHTNPQDIADEQADGNQWGFYNGFRPSVGAVITDADAIEFRVMPWIIWKHNIDQYFYWETTYYRDGNNSNTDINVFVDPVTFDNGNSSANGDGTFFYPGDDRIYTEQDRGLAGPLASIRMKNWRRGAQDFEYLWLAREAGLDTQAGEIVQTCVPAAVWDADLDQDISWPAHGHGFETCRQQLAELLAGPAGIDPKEGHDGIHKDQFMFSIAGRGMVFKCAETNINQIIIYDLHGSEIRRIPVTSNTVVWDGQDRTGRPMKSRAFLVKMIMDGNRIIVWKAVLQ
jgi:hypothetical protein